MSERPNAFSLAIPTWAPAAVAVAFVLWAASIWWMVTTLPAGDDTAAIEGVLDAVVAELERANTSIETLDTQVAGLEGERDALLTRVDQLESRGPAGGAFQMSTGTDAVDED